MKSTIQNLTESKSISLSNEIEYLPEYKNPLGVIYGNNIHLNNQNILASFDTRNIKKMYLTKIRVYRKNFFTLSFSLLLFTLNYFFGYFDLFLFGIVYLIATFFLIISFTIKCYEYKLIVVTKDYVPNSIRIDLGFIGEAKELVKKVNKKLRLNDGHEQLLVIS